MIINSFLQSDYYKFTMGQFAFHFQPERPKMGEYSMKCRNGVNLLPFLEEIKREVLHWMSLKPSEKELEYLENLKINGYSVFQKDYIDFLRDIDLESNLEIEFLNENDQLNIRVKGEWKYSIFAEIPVLAIVQEVYWRNVLSEEEYLKREAIFEERLNAKFDYIQTTDVKFAEFGTRRRFSAKLQERFIQKFKDSKNCVGTSNVYLAMKYGLTPQGTTAHEYLQYFQVLGSSFESSQREAIEAWAKEYPNMLKVMLTDILGFDMFMKDCSKEMALHYDLRQDSGDPKEMAYKAIKWYESLGIDPKTKMILFSDDLNFEKDNALNLEFKDKLRATVFGNGTYCSNDTGLKPVSLVMKVVRVNDKPVIKVSDSEGKIMCEDQDMIEWTKKYIDSRLNH